MSADRLREAARLMRERAKGARAGRWEAANNAVRAMWQSGPRHITTCGGSLPEGNALNAAHIASWHPAVALAVAKWLDDVAAGWMWDDVDEDGYGGVSDSEGFPLKFEESIDTHALAVANAYLGSES